MFFGKETLMILRGQNDVDNLHFLKLRQIFGSNKGIILVFGNEILRGSKRG